MFDNNKLNFQSTHRHLGLIFSEDCKWSAHIDNIMNKASKRLSLMKLLKYKLSITALSNIYITYIRPLLEHVSNSLGRVH